MPTIGQALSRQSSLYRMFAEKTKTSLALGLQPNSRGLGHKIHYQWNKDVQILKLFPQEVIKGYN